MVPSWRELLPEALGMNAGETRAHGAPHHPSASTQGGRQAPFRTARPWRPEAAWRYAAPRDCGPWLSPARAVGAGCADKAAP